MKWLARHSTILFVAVALATQARDRTPVEETPEMRQAASEQDLLLLGPLEPIRLRLVIEIDGVPFQTAWRNAFDRLFDQFDVDRDGRLTTEQAAQVLAIFVRDPSNRPANGLLKEVSGTLEAPEKRQEDSVPESSRHPFQQANETTAILKKVSGTLEAPEKLQENGAPESSRHLFQDKPQMMSATSVTRDELRKQVEQSAPPLTLRQRLSSGGAGPALIPLLDTDGDRRLSREELDAAERSLHCRDFNDDQLIIEQELLAGPTLSSNTNPDENGVSNGSVILMTRSLDAAAIAEILLARYDRNRDGALSLQTPAEILSTEGRLSTLDKDADGSLNRSELREFVQLPLDAVLPLNLGSGNAAQQKKAQALPHYRLRRKLDGGYRISFGSSELDFRRNNRDPSQDNARPRMSDFDGDMNKYLDEAEFMNVTDRPELAVVDSDHDGKVTESEFDAFFLNRSRATAAQLVLEVSDQGSDLFTALDRNFDRVLTPRELHQASQLLDTEDRDHDGYLGGVEMSYNLILELSRGGPKPITNNGIAGLRSSAEPQVKGDRSGPSWFTKMDRNRDGDVSLLEFAGNRETFLKLDKNADGLISATEATEATAKPTGATGN